VPHYSSLVSSPNAATRDGKSLATPVRRLQIFVVFNGEETTAAALRCAGAFVQGLGGEIFIVASRIVPYPLPLQCPSVDSESFREQISRAVEHSGIDCGVQKVLVANTRVEQDGWKSLLPPHCIVFVGTSVRSPLQRFRSWRNAQRLRKLGHEVLLA
jgi:hypothetical protein